MDYIANIITGSRQDTKNTDTNSIADSLWVRWANWAQDRAQSLITGVHPNFFRTSEEQNTAVDTAEYTLSSRRLLFGTRIVDVKYSRTGQLKDYIKLTEKGIHTRGHQSGDPCHYIRENGSLVLDPIPNDAVGKIKVTYEYECDDLALRNGQINGNPSGTDIVLSSPSATEETNLSTARYICVSDADGEVLLRNGLVSSYDDGTDTITLAANVSTYLVTGVALSDLASAYVTIGKDTSTHSQLPDICERYIGAYMNVRATRLDKAAKGSEDATRELAAIEKEIVEAYKIPDKDIDEIQVVDAEIMLDGF